MFGCFQAAAVAIHAGVVYLVTLHIVKNCVRATCAKIEQ
jgi:hypothetical protein